MRHRHGKSVTRGLEHGLLANPVPEEGGRLLSSVQIAERRALSCGQHNADQCFVGRSGRDHLDINADSSDRTIARLAPGDCQGDDIARMRNREIKPAARRQPRAPMRISAAPAGPVDGNAGGTNAELSSDDEPRQRHAHRESLTVGCPEVAAMPPPFGLVQQLGVPVRAVGQRGPPHLAVIGSQGRYIWDGGTAQRAAFLAGRPMDLASAREGSRSMPLARCRRQAEPRRPARIGRNDHQVKIRGFRIGCGET